MIYAISSKQPGKYSGNDTAEVIGRSKIHQGTGASFKFFKIWNSPQFHFEKWYCDQKIISFFPFDFESVFAKHPTGKILSFVFYPKAVYFECKFWI